MVEVSDEVLAELAGPVATALPMIVARIPPAPAAELGRLRANADGGTWPVRRWAGGHRTMARSSSGGRPGPVDSPVRDALGSLPPLLVERLLGALELSVPELDLTVGPEITDEQDIAAAHGAAQLALAVATAAAVLHRVGVRLWATEPPAVLGVAIGTAVLLLREAPMPAGYAAALRARARAEYLMPRQSGGSAPVSGHRFALLEGTDVPEVDFGGNGLVAVVPGGAVIRTGIETGHAQILLRILDGPPPEVATGWDEIVEVGWRAAVGGASVVGPDAGDPRLRKVTPPWPGDYRLRVHARGRDDTDEGDTEYYELVVWQAPAAPETVYARTDRLGHRLRGEPEPTRPERPETAYRWLRRSSLSEAATVTVVTGADVAAVLRDFGADAAQPESMRAIGEDLMSRQSIDPWVAVLDVGGAVLAVEYNGWQGSTTPVLTRASADRRAASMYWNVNGLTRLSFAEHGEVLLSVEPFADLDAPPQVALTLAGLDFADHHRGKELMGLVAVQRFTGHGITAEDLTRIETAGIGFRIVPDLPTLYPHRPQPGNPLDPATEALTELPEPKLRDLAWWAAAEAARYAGLGEDPDIVASVAARTLTPDAHLRARRSQLDGGEHPWLWLALHRATNPDPVAAVTDTVEAARYAAGPYAANLVADAQAWTLRSAPQ